MNAIVAGELGRHSLVVGNVGNGVECCCVTTENDGLNVSRRKRDTKVGLEVIEQSSRAQGRVGCSIVSDSGRVGKLSRVGRQANHLSSRRVGVHDDLDDVLRDAKVGQVGGARSQNLLSGVLDRCVGASRCRADRLEVGVDFRDDGTVGAAQDCKEMHD